jgi:hypothetical protein
MTIKQQGGIFGRNPSFNDLEAEQATVNGVVNIQSNRPQIFLYEQDRTDNNARIEVTGDNLRFSQVDDENSSVVPRVTLEMDTGNFTVNDGNLIIGTSGQGIDFSATSGTGTSELFDDYEEGTWTPTFQGSTSGSISFASAGYYTKIGRIVRASFYLTSKDFSAAAIVGTLEIAGLPYNVGVLGQGLGNLAVNNFIAGASDYVPYAYSTDRLRVSKGTTSTVTDADLTQSTSRAIAVSITYMAS